MDTLGLGRRYPLAVVGGRQGSIEAAEEFLLLRGKDKVVPVLLEVLSKHMRADKPLSDAAEGHTKPQGIDYRTDVPGCMIEQHKFLRTSLLAVVFGPIITTCCSYVASGQVQTPMA